ncbi:MAG: transcriptional repressor [Pseudomonadota bacterium]
MKTASLVQRAAIAGAKMTEQRKLVCRTLERCSDHPDAEQVFHRARKLEPKIALATVYRTLKALVDMGLVITHDFGDGRTRYEFKDEDHHDHLICTTSGKVIEFHDPELESLKKKIAKRLGYALESHSLELYGRPADPGEHSV